MRPKLPAAAMVFVLAAGIYLPAIGHPFQFDDQLFLRDGNVTAGRWEAFVWPPVARALTWMTFLVQGQFGEPDPTFFRAFNIAVHGLNAVLVFLLLAKLLALPTNRAAEGGAPTRDLSPTGGAPTRDLSPTEPAARRDLSPASIAAAVFGGLLFGLHPVQSEAVLLVYQRSTLLAAFFGFLGLLIWMGDGRAAAGWGRQRPAAAWLRTAAVCVCFLLGVAGKEFMAVFPLLLWCYDGLLRGDWKPRRSVLAMLGLGGVFAVAHLALAAGPEAVALNWRSSLAYALTEVRVWWLYLFLIVGLIPQNVDHTVAAQATLRDWQWWSALAGLALCVGLFLKFRRRHAQAAFCGAAYGLFLFPTSGLLSSPDFMFEHRVYASMLGVAGLTALGLRAGLDHGRVLKLAFAAAGMSIVVLSAAATYRRSQVWRSPVTLWSDAAAKSPDKYRAQFNLGAALSQVDPEAAAERLSRAVTIDPGRPLAYRALGELKLRLGERRAARAFFEQARILDPSDWRTWNALGTIHLLERDYRRATDRLSEAARLAPTEAEPRLQLARLNLLFGFVKEAIGHAQAGLEWNPDSLELTLALANAVAADLNWGRAEELYRRALRIDPARSEAHYGLARALLGLGRPEEAVDAARLGLRHASTPSERELGERLIQQGRGRPPQG